MILRLMLSTVTRVPNRSESISVAYFIILFWKELLFSNSETPAKSTASTATRAPAIFRGSSILRIIRLMSFGHDGTILPQIYNNSCR